MSEQLSLEDLERSRDEYDRDGYAIMRGVFSGADVSELLDLVTPLFANFDTKLNSKIRDVGAIDGLQPGSQQPEIDRATMIEPALLHCNVYRKTQEIASFLLGRNAHYVFDHFISKMPHSDTETAWHQDRGYMKANTTLNTVNFWVPLQPVNTENGTLYYIPGSHLGESLKHERDPALHPHVLTTKVTSKNETPVCLAAGDLTFHHPLTLHGAGPNKTDRERVAWSLHFGSYGRLEYAKPSNLLGMMKRGVDMILPRRAG